MENLKEYLEVIGWMVMIIASLYVISARTFHRYNYKRREKFEKAIESELREGYLLYEEVVKIVEKEFEVTRKKDE